jgi:hypothetical protein
MLVAWEEQLEPEACRKNWRSVAALLVSKSEANLFRTEGLSME